MAVPRHGKIAERIARIVPIIHGEDESAVIAERGVGYDVVNARVQSIICRICHLLFSAEQPTHDLTVVGDKASAAVLIGRADGLKICLVLYIEHGEFAYLLGREPLRLIQGYELTVCVRDAGRAVVFIAFADDEIDGSAAARDIGDIAVPHRADVQNSRKQVWAAVHYERKSFPAARIAVGIHPAAVYVVIADKILCEGDRLICRSCTPIAKLGRNYYHFIVIALRYEGELLGAQVCARAEAVQPS